MTEFRAKSFDSLFDRKGDLVLENMFFEDCRFSNCALSLTKDASMRSVVRHIGLKNCSANGCGIGPAIFEDVDVSGLATNDLLIIWGALFGRVKLSGAIDKIKINHFAHFSDRAVAIQKPFDDQRIAYYNSIDWALDISEARFKEFDVRGIPARLIRRDPETQVVVTRDRALKSGWLEKLSPSNKLWPFMIKLFLSDCDLDMVLVAPLGAPKKKRDDLIRGLHELRAIGVAEPD